MSGDDSYEDVLNNLTMLTPGNMMSMMGGMGASTPIASGIPQTPGITTPYTPYASGVPQTPGITTPIHTPVHTPITPVTPGLVNHQAAFGSLLSPTYNLNSTMNPPNPPANGSLPTASTTISSEHGIVPTIQ